VSEKSDLQDGTVARTAAPERAGVKDPPRPDYPRYRVEPGKRVSLAEIDPGETEHYRKNKDVKKKLEGQRQGIRDLQGACTPRTGGGLLIVLQAMDTGGKNGTIKHVFEGINPQRCRVSSFKAPSAEEANHDFLWRYHKSVPAKGRIGIFNRSHYLDVLIVRVKDLVPEEVWRPRYGIINDFERTLTAGGITVLKFFLYISKDE
jgi:polyphosphate kinase 2 (PPK2 family)